MRSPILYLALFLALAGLFFIPTFLLSYAQSVPTFVFLRDLQLGDRGPDVIELRKILSSDSGVDISGDSNYFGPEIFDSVLRFQNKYSDEILRPAGLTQGSGFVGLWTRLKLNQILLKTSVGRTPAKNLVQNSSEELMLAFPSVNYGVPGSELTLSGSGFSLTSNTIYFSKGKKVVQKIENVAAKNSKEITFQVPNIATGRYDITLSNGTKKDSGTLPFMVTVTGALVPVVESVSPTQTNFGETITVTGQNFTPTGNIVSSNIGIIKDIKSADGKTMSFVLSSPEYFDDKWKLDELWFSGKVNMEWPVIFRVINENGVSADNPLAKFQIKI